MNITVQNPEALAFKHPNIEGICTKANVITAWPSNLPTLSQELIDDYDAEYIAYLESTAYIEKRVNEYPTIGDQIGALLKAEQGDDTELKEIITKVNAVKTKYPKP